MKKLFSILMILCLAMFVIGCGEKPADTPADDAAPAAADDAAADDAADDAAADDAADDAAADDAADDAPAGDDAATP
jgi:hypothetical protein